MTGSSVAVAVFFRSLSSCTVQHCPIRILRHWAESGQNLQPLIRLKNQPAASISCHIINIHQWPTFDGIYKCPCYNTVATMFDGWRGMLGIMSGYFHLHALPNILLQLSVERILLQSSSGCFWRFVNSPSWCWELPQISTFRGAPLCLFTFMAVSLYCRFWQWYAHLLKGVLDLAGHGKGIFLAKERPLLCFRFLFRLSFLVSLLITLILWWQLLLLPLISLYFI